MESIILATVATGSFIMLADDFKKRQQFNNFMSTKSDDTYKLIEGVVKQTRFVNLALFQPER